MCGKLEILEMAEKKFYHYGRMRKTGALFQFHQLHRPDWRKRFLPEMLGALQFRPVASRTEKADACHYGERAELKTAPLRRIF